MSQLAILPELQLPAMRARDEQYTPSYVIEAARHALGGSIDLDPASNAVAQETIKAGTWYGLDCGRDGLTLPWFGRVWLNPPYSRGRVDAFADRAVAELERGEIQTMLVLVNASTCSGWFHRLLRTCDHVIYPLGRLAFEDGGTRQIRTGNEYDQLLLSWGCGRRLDSFKQLGWVVR